MSRAIRPIWWAVSIPLVWAISRKAFGVGAKTVFRVLELLGGDRMIQTIRKKLRVFRIPKHRIALLAGSSPIILAFILMYVTEYTLIFHDTGWFKYLVQNQDEFVQSLIVSSIMIAVFSTLLRVRLVTFVAGFQPVIIQIMFILADVNQHIVLSLSIVAITILPLLILLTIFIKDIDQIDNQEGIEKPIDSEKQDTGT